MPFLSLEKQNEFWRNLEPHSQLFNPIIIYFTKQFEIKYGNDFWSHDEQYGDTHTQSALEGFHKRMKRLFPDGPGPDVNLFSRQMYIIDKEDLCEAQFLRSTLKELKFKKKL